MPDVTDPGPGAPVPDLPPGLAAELAALADAPPAPPAGPAAVRTRATRRRVARRRRRAMAGVVALGAAATVLWAFVLAPPEPDRTTTVDGPAATPQPDGARLTTDAAGNTVAVGRDPGLTIAPADGVEPGDRVEVTLAETAGRPAFVALCAAEAVDDASSGTDVAPWCTAITEVPTASPGPVALEVQRFVDTADGRVDCTVAPGRCVVGVRPSGAALDGGGDLFAALSFARPDPATPPELAVDGGDLGRFRDGEAMTVRGGGFAPQDDVVIEQCAGDVCDAVRTARARTAADGTFQVDVVVYRDLGVVTYGGDTVDGEGTLTWRPCEPCALRATGAASPVASVAFEVRPTDRPVHPAIELIPAGPHAPGATVRLEGRGFQPGGAAPQVGWCLAGRPARCVYPNAGMGVSPVGPDGTLVVDAFSLPTATQDLFGAVCTAAPGTCSVIVQNAHEGSPALDEVPLDLSG